MNNQKKLYSVWWRLLGFGLMGLVAIVLVGGGGFLGVMFGLAFSINPSGTLAGGAILGLLISIFLWRRVRRG